MKTLAYLTMHKEAEKPNTYIMQLINYIIRFWIYNKYIKNK